VQDIGAGKGKYYAVNFPLRDGIDDDSYEQTFRPVSTNHACCMLNNDNHHLHLLHHRQQIKKHIKTHKITY